MKFGRYVVLFEYFPAFLVIFNSMQVERKIDDFIKLDQELRTAYGNNLKSLPLGDKVELNELEQYLNQVLTFGEKDFWQTEGLFVFLDTCTEKSVIRDIQIKSMREKVILHPLIHFNCYSVAKFM
jgi:hypothetical protein